MSFFANLTFFFSASSNKFELSIHQLSTNVSNSCSTAQCADETAHSRPTSRWLADSQADAQVGRVGIGSYKGTLDGQVCRWIHI